MHAPYAQKDRGRCVDGRGGPEEHTTRKNLLNCLSWDAHIKKVREAKRDVGGTERTKCINRLGGIAQCQSLSSRLLHQVCI